ncbi:MAG: OmpA family protein [Salinivirgaceae bacterium]|nr:OmpA family protein [Salinivirgaceae bacterium]
MICKKLILCTLVAAIGPLAGQAQTDMFPEFTGSVTNVAITHTGDKMVFIGEKGEGRGIFESVKKNGQWGEAMSIPVLRPLLENQIGGFSFNHDGTQLLFHAKTDKSFDIMYVTLENGQWGNITRFDEPVNSQDDEFSPSLSVDNQYIFFLRPKQTADKSDNACKQIVMYSRQSDGTWVGPQEIPQSFNTGCQETPFFCADEKTLFFASKRIDTTPEGKKLPDDVYNIYYSKLVSEAIYENGWTIPKYTDYLSTSHDDLSPQLSIDGTIIKNTSPKKPSKKQPNKTYEYNALDNLKPKPTMLLSGTITDRASKEPVAAQVIVSNLITSAVLGSYTTDDNGRYSIFLDENGNYKIDYFKDGYSHSYHYEKTGYYTRNIKKQFDTTIFSVVDFDLNVFDEEMYSPLSPKISVYDSTTSELLIDSLPPIELGKYKSRLNIGKTYKVHIECPHYKPQDIFLNTIADIFYNEFEEDVELIPTKTAMILDVDAGQDGDSVMVKVKNLSRNETRTVVAKRDKDGNLIVELREGDSYEIDVAKKGYTYSSTKVDVSKSKKTQKLNIKLDLLTKDTKMTFNSITFEVNSSELNTASYTELNRIIEFLKLNDNVKIELSAHTDDLGSDWYNMRLSEKRAQMAAKYLTDNGISERMIRTKGYGESKPIVPNTSDENRALNRRVEIKIIE